MTTTVDLQAIGRRAKDAARRLATLGTDVKNRAVLATGALNDARPLRVVCCDAGCVVMSGLLCRVPGPVGRRCCTHNLPVGGDVAIVGNPRFGPRLAGRGA